MKKQLIFTFSILLTSLSLSASLSAEENASSQTKVDSATYPQELKNAISAINKGNYDNALKELEALKPQIKTNKNGKKQVVTPNVPLEYKKYLKGVSLRKLGKFAEAKQALKESLALRGSNGDVVAELAFTELALGEKDSALQDFQEALWFANMKEHSSADIYYQIGFILQGQEKNEKAIENYRLALGVAPTHVMSTVKLAELQFANGEKKPAIKLLKNLIDQSKATAEARQLLATILLSNADPLIDGVDIKYALEVISPVFQDKNQKNRELSPAFSVYIKALILNDKLLEADKEVTKALAKGSKDPVLQRLAQQIALEKKSLENSNGAVITGK